MGDLVDKPTSTDPNINPTPTDVDQLKPCGWCGSAAIRSKQSGVQCSNWDCVMSRLVFDESEWEARPQQPEGGPLNADSVDKDPREGRYSTDVDQLTVSQLRDWIADKAGDLPIRVMIEFDGKGQWEAGLNDMAVAMRWRATKDEGAQYVVLMHEELRR